MKPNWTEQNLSPIHWFWIALACFLPLHASAVVFDSWFLLPPKPIGDGPDYEAIGYGLSQGYGWSTSFSDPQWRSAYEGPAIADAALDYSVQLARVGPVVADTNRPPLLPLCIAAVYQCLPRGPMAFAAVRLGLAGCLSLGCAIAVAWSVALARSATQNLPRLAIPAVGIAMIAIVYSERNVRNYTTDFLTEPLALLLTQLFLAVAWVGVHKKSWSWAVGAGALFAGMVFCRGVFVLWIPLVLVWLGYLVSVTNVAQGTVPRVPNRLSAGGWLLVCGLAFALIASAWWVRNCYVLGALQPLGTKGAITLLGGYCDEALEANGEWQFAPEKALRQRLESSIELRHATPEDLIRLELAMGEMAAVQVKKWASENWQRLPSLIVQRVITEWNPYNGKALVLKLLALVGALWLLRVNRIVLIWLAGPLAINTFFVGATYSVGGRFLVPTYGPLYILAAFGMTVVLGWLADRLWASQSRVAIASGRN